MGQNVYQMKATILGTKPPVWRRLLVPEDIRLSELHQCPAGRLRLVELPPP